MSGDLAAHILNLDKMEVSDQYHDLAVYFRGKSPPVPIG